jgi:hypothetical protein
LASLQRVAVNFENEDIDTYAVVAVTVLLTIVASVAY